MTRDSSNGRDILRTWWDRSGLRVKVVLWATSRTDYRGQTIIGYALTCKGHVVFTGEDFAGSPMHADDSNATLASLLTFLALRPGDTDRDYFDAYTPEQMAFAEEHGEQLGWLAHELETKRRR